MCICDMGKVLSKTHLTNEHCENKNIELNLVRDSDSYGIALFQNNYAIGIYTIMFCPICGRKLEQETT